MNRNESSQYQACPKAAACRIMLTVSLVLILVIEYLFHSPLPLGAVSGLYGHVAESPCNFLFFA